jgi:hypothetical protein
VPPLHRDAPSFFATSPPSPRTAQVSEQTRTTTWIPTLTLHRPSAPRPPLHLPPPLGFTTSLGSPPLFLHSYRLAPQPPPHVAQPAPRSPSPARPRAASSLPPGALQCPRSASPRSGSARGPQGGPRPSPALLCAAGGRRCVKADALRAATRTHSPAHGRPPGAAQGGGARRREPRSPIALPCPGRAAPPPPLLRAGAGDADARSALGAQTCGSRTGAECGVSAGPRGARSGASRSSRRGRGGG